MKLYKKFGMALGMIVALSTGSAVAQEGCGGGYRGYGSALLACKPVDNMGDNMGSVAETNYGSWVATRAGALLVCSTEGMYDKFSCSPGNTQIEQAIRGYGPMRVYVCGAGAYGTSGGCILQNEKTSGMSNTYFKLPQMASPSDPNWVYKYFAIFLLNTGSRVTTFR